MNKILRLLKSREGFTLIELMIVIVVLGILASIAVPKLSEVREKANIAVIKSDLHNIQIALEMYYVDNNSYPADTVDPGVEDIPVDALEITLSDLVTDSPDLSYKYDLSDDGTEYLVYIQYPASDDNYYFIKSGTGVSSKSDGAPTL